MTQNLQIFGAGVQGRSPVVCAQRRINAYVDIEREPDRSRVTFHGFAGLTELCDLGETPVRGLVSLGSFLYVVHRGTLYRVRNDGVETSLGTLTTTEGPVTFASNNDYLMLVDGVNGYTYLPSSETFAQITDPQFPANPTSCTFNNGYFMVSQADSEQFDLSALDDPTSWSGTDFDLAYADPDELLAVWSHSGLTVMLGPKSLEYWGYTGDTFPFARVVASQYGWGLAARASLAPMESDGMALLRRREGGLGVCRLTGTTPQLVSPPELCALFDGFAEAHRVDDAVGASYSVAGHPFYQLTFPTAGATWVYDGASNIWSERVSEGLTHFRGLHGVLHQGVMYWGDGTTGQVWQQSAPGVRADKSLDWTDVVWIEGQDDDGNDRPVPFELRSRHIFLPGNTRFVLSALQVDMAEGEGAQTGQGSSPRAMLSLSRNKGRSFGPELTQSMGATGDYDTRVRWTRLGQHRDCVVRLRITDPVPRVVTGEVLDIQPGVS